MYVSTLDSVCSGICTAGLRRVDERRRSAENYEEFDDLAATAAAPPKKPRGSR
jgi:hypothetical protein